MTQDHMLYELTPLGYLVVECAATGTQAKDVHPTAGQYHGVDRLPAFIAPDPIIREQLGLNQAKPPVVGGNI